VTLARNLRRGEKAFTDRAPVRKSEMPKERRKGKETENILEGAEAVICEALVSKKMEVGAENGKDRVKKGVRKVQTLRGESKQPDETRT